MCVAAVAVGGREGKIENEREGKREKRKYIKMKNMMMSLDEI